MVFSNKPILQSVSDIKMNDSKALLEYVMPLKTFQPLDNYSFYNVR